MLLKPNLWDGDSEETAVKNSQNPQRASFMPAPVLNTAWTTWSPPLIHNKGTPQSSENYDLKKILSLEQAHLVPSPDLN